MERIKRQAAIRLPARASLWYILSSAVSRSVGVMGTPIFTRLLTPEEYGLYPLYNTWLGLLTVIVTLELTGGVILRGLQKYAGREDEFISAALGLILTVFSLFSAIYFVFRERISSLCGLSVEVFALLLLQILLNAVINLYSARSKYSYRYKSVALINICSAFGIPLLSIAFIYLTKLHAEARILGGIIVTAIIAMPLMFKMLKGGKIYNSDIWRYLLRFNIPLLPHYLSMAVILRVGELTVGRVYGQEALGKYSVAMSVGLSLSMVTNGLISALSPWILRRIRAGEVYRIKDFLFILTQGLSIFCLLVLSIVPETMRIITPVEYHDCLIAVYPLALSSVPMFLSSAIMSGQLYYERNAISSFPSIVAALTSTGLSFLLLPILDYRFISLSVLVSYITLMLLNTLIFKRLSGQMPIYFKGTAKVFSLCLLYALLLALLKDAFLLRMLLAVPLLFILYPTAKEVWKRIKE